MTKYYEEHREKCLAQAKEWAEKHKAERKEYRAKWYQENKERLRPIHNAYSKERYRRLKEGKANDNKAMCKDL